MSKMIKTDCDTINQYLESLYIKEVLENQQVHLPLWDE